jgi:hypothetical protein
MLSAIHVLPSFSQSSAHEHETACPTRCRGLHYAYPAAIAKEQKDILRDTGI